MGKRCLVLVAAGVLALTGACGDDDGGDDENPEAAVEDMFGDDDEELALGDPCELVTADDVGEVVGFDVTSELTNVDDDLPGATCMYTGDGGEGTVQLNVTPDGADLFDASAESDLAEPGPVGLGDASYLVEAGELGVRVGDHYIQVVVRGTGLTLEDQGVEIAELAVASLG